MDIVRRRVCLGSCGVREASPFVNVHLHCTRPDIPINSHYTSTMSQRALSLPIRTLSSKAVKPQWICRRCLATQTSSSAKVDYRNLAPEELLSRPLKQKAIPAHYLQHVNAESLPISEQEQWEKVTPHKKTVGVVVSHGKMDKTVRVKVAGQRWNKAIKKVGHILDNSLEVED